MRSAALGAELGVLRVVRGNPTQDEVVAAVATLSRLASAGASMSTEAALARHAGTSPANPRWVRGPRIGRRLPLAASVVSDAWRWQNRV